MPNMCRDFLVLRATKSNETTHVLCTAPISIWWFQRSRSTMSCRHRTATPLKLLNLFLCLYYLTKKQSDTVYKNAPVVMIVLI